MAAIHIRASEPNKDQRGHLNRNIRFQFKVELFSIRYSDRKQIQTSNCSMVIGSLTY